MSCSSDHDCPTRFRCYFPSHGWKIGECQCFKSMLFSGDDCRERGMSSLAAFSFSIVVYLLCRQTYISSRVFSVHYDKWKAEQASFSSALLPVPLVASIWLFISSIGFSTVGIINLTRCLNVHFDRLESLLIYISGPIFALAQIFTLLSALVTGNFWLESGLQQRQSSAGRSHVEGRLTQSTYRFRSSTLLLSLAFLLCSVTSFAFAWRISYYLTAIPAVLTVVWCAVGSFLAQQELRKLGAGNRRRQRVLQNLRSVGVKFFCQSSWCISLFMFWNIIEFNTFGTEAPALLCHVTILVFYVSVCALFSTLGEYLASQKVHSTVLEVAESMLLGERYRGRKMGVFFYHCCQRRRLQKVCMDPGFPNGSLPQQAAGKGAKFSRRSSSLKKKGPLSSIPDEPEKEEEHRSSFGASGTSTAKKKTSNCQGSL